VRSPSTLTNHAHPDGPYVSAHRSHPASGNPAIPAELEAVIPEAAGQDTKDRVQSCRELAEILLRLRVAGGGGLTDQEASETAGPPRSGTFITVAMMFPAGPPPIFVQ